MGNIVNDIVDDVVDYNEETINSKNSKILIKIITAVSIALIGFAFTIGQFRSTIVNNLESFESTLSTQTSSIEDLETELNAGFKDVHKRIDKVYVDGLEAFDDYQRFNKEQLILVLDYGQNNKELLKKMLEVNSQENTKKIENQINDSKYNYDSKSEIGDVPIKSEDSSYKSLNFIINDVGDTTYYLTGATLKYIENIDKNKYEIDDLKINLNHSDVYDVTYHNKK